MTNRKAKDRKAERQKDRDRQTDRQTDGQTNGCYLSVWSEGLLHVGVLEEPGDGEDVGAGVHQDEEEHSSGEDTGELGIVL